MTKKPQLVFIPSPGHLLSTVEMAKALVHRLSITVLVMKLPFNSKVITYLDSLSTANNINFIHLPNDDLPLSNSRNFIMSFIESQKPHIKEAVTKLVQNESASGDSPRLAGFVLDMICTNMMDIADEFGVPSYIFFTSSASFLGLMLYTQKLNDEQNKSTAELKDSDTELAITGFVNSFPVSVLPSVFLEKDWAMFLFEHARKFRRVKGIIVNTFMELESSVIKSLSDGKTNVPPVHTVGPILSLNGDSMDIGSGESTTKSEIMEWLDDQPSSSVVFLCFGSMGSFSEDQVKEIAYALEQSGHRFLWSLRKHPPKDQVTAPSDYMNPTDVLPEGFLDRTADIGKIIGWAPPVSILAHKAIGGFVSHCGWNSTLESIWFGVPMAAWPIYSEQQINAFELVIELGLAVEIKMDYRRDFLRESPMIVSAEEIERGIKKLMVNDSEVRKRMKEMSKKSRKALMEGGSSFFSLGCFIDDVIGPPTTLGSRPS